MKALIGTGTIGESLKEINFDFIYNSSNIDQITNNEFDVVVCAAPSANRIIANNIPNVDDDSIDKLIYYLTIAKIKKLVLISTVDTINYPMSVYGKNRLRLEQFVKDNFVDYHILRLSTLIGQTIKKNVLYDLCHEQFLDKIDSESCLQWYPLSNLTIDIFDAISDNIKEVNLVSAPIKNSEILDEFFPHLKDRISPQSQSRTYGLTPYIHTKEEIFEEIANYIHLRR